MNIWVLTVHTPFPIFYYKEFLNIPKSGETVSREISLYDGYFFFNEKFDL